MNNLMETTVVQVVRHYRELGFNPIPIRARSKAADLPRGHEFLSRKATDDEFEGFTWDGNVGIVTGKTSNLIVVDEDQEGALQALGWTVPPTVIVRTGKGFQYYFRHPGGYVKNRTGDNNRLGPGVELKGDGGYVVAPPSVHPNGKRYVWEVSPDAAAIEEAPEWLLEKIKGQEQERTVAVAVTPEKITDGNRNATLFSRARSLFAQGYNASVVSAAIHELNQSACNPPLPESEVQQIVESASKYERGQIIPSKNGVLTTSAIELLSKTFSPVRWAVPEILPEGVTLFAGKAKIGKSWFALGLCIAVATGGYALGKKPVEQGDSLYLALEDNERRLQDRINQQFSGDPELLAPMHYATHWPKFDAGGVEKLDEWLEQHPNARLVVIDTLKKVGARDNGRRNIYDVDYESLEPLGPLAAKHNVSIMVIHHMNKMVEPSDPFDAISGSTGLTGSVDGVLILNRERGRADAFLYVDGRDIKEQGELALSWDAQLSNWTLQGDAEQYRISKERQEIIRAIREAGEPVTPTYISETLDKNFSTTKNLLIKMVQAGELVNNNGKYGLP